MLDERGPRARREPAREAVDRGPARGRSGSRAGCSRAIPARPLVVPYDGRRPTRAARLPERGRRPRRLRGASVRLHRSRLARAADAARAPAQPARDGAAARRGRSRELVEQARREVEQITRADRRGAFPQRARVRRARSSRSARRRAARCSRRSRRSSRSGPRGQGSRSSSRATLDRARVRRRMLRVVAQNLAENAIRYAGPGATFTLSRLARRTTRSSSRPPTTASASSETSCHACSSASTAPTARARRGHRARARDREARRHVRRRHGRGARRHGAGLEIRCIFPARRLTAFTGSSPDGHQPAPHRLITVHDPAARARRPAERTTTPELTRLGSPRHRRADVASRRRPRPRAGVRDRRPDRSLRRNVGSRT